MGSGICMATESESNPGFTLRMLHIAHVLMLDIWDTSFVLSAEKNWPFNGTWKSIETCILSLPLGLSDSSKWLGFFFFFLPSHCISCLLQNTCPCSNTSPVYQQNEEALRGVTATHCDFVQWTLLGRGAGFCTAINDFPLLSVFGFTCGWWRQQIGQRVFLCFTSP